MKQLVDMFSGMAAASIFLAGTTSAAAAASAGLGPSFRGPIGLQLYSLRDAFPKDVAGTVGQVRGFGFRYVELAGTYNQSPAQFKALLDANRLRAVSGHFAYERYHDDVQGVAHEARALGLRYVGCAWIPHSDPFDEKTCREAIAVFNRAGEALAKHGLKFFYHVHGYEFQPHGDGTLLDLLMTETKPEFVNYEMDIFWIAHPGRDPVKLLQKYGNRWELMHLKDMRKGTRTGELTGHSDVRNDVALGAGQLDVPAILAAARHAGVRWYFIEDESPSSAAQIPVSLRYLEQVRW